MIKKNDATRAGSALLLALSLFNAVRPASVMAASHSHNAPLVLAPASVEVTPACFAEYTGDNTTDFSSADATAVQQAVDAAASGGTVKVAGTCAGWQNLGGDILTVFINKSLTLVGGFTNSDWTTSNPQANPTILDGQDYGRVIYATAPLTISNLTIQKGKVPVIGDIGGGGAYFQETATLTGVTFISNTAPFNDRGGGAYFNGAASLTGVTFAGNSVVYNNLNSSGGGGAYFSGAAMLSNTTFMSNTASGNTLSFGGGGAYFAGKAFLMNTAFIGNLAKRISINQRYSYGGGAYFEDTATITSTTFTNNYAELDGGGARFIRTATLINTTFTGNVANDLGGGALIEDDATLTGTTFISNTTGNYGGGALIFKTAIMTNTTFISNTAGKNGGGGEFGTVIVTGATFISNTAGENGGGISANTVLLTGTTFKGNTAKNGGGLYIGQSPDPSRINNSLFARNSSTTGTGAAAMYLLASGSGGGLVDVVHTTIASSTLSDGTAIAVGKGTVNITNTIIASHTIGINQTGSAVVNSNYNLFFNNDSDVFGSVITGSNSVIGNPRFVNPNADNYRLTVTSAAINAGANAGITNDFDGNPRPNSNKFDIGAFEFMNQAPTANAGAPQTVLIKASVTLNGSASIDPEGQPLSYGWSQVAGTPVALTNSNTASPAFTAPGSAMTTTLTFQLVVTDSLGLASAPAQVVITVTSNRVMVPLVIR